MRQITLEGADYRLQPAQLAVSENIPTTDELIEIPGYDIHSRLSGSAQEECYLATQMSLQRMVAVRVQVRRDSPATRRFVREGRLLASLSHPAILTIYDIRRLPDGRHYQAVEFVEGGDLARRLTEPMTTADALSIVRQLAEGLRAVHESRLVHANVTPETVLFREDGSVVLTGFHAARAMTTAGEPATVQWDSAPGPYASPEHHDGGMLDERSDVYSLGVLLLEMLTGSNPLVRNENRSQATQRALALLPGAQTQYRPLLERMLAVEPQRRFKDCDELLAALPNAPEQPPAPMPPSRLAEPLPDKAPTPSVSATSALFATPPHGEPRQTAPVRAPRRSRRWSRLIGGSVALLLLVGIAIGGGLYLYERWQTNHLIALADQRFAEGRLMEPDQDNADYYYREALTIDAGNTEAWDGVQRVLQARVTQFIGLGQQRVAEGRLLAPADDSAEHYFQKALELAPGNGAAKAGMQHVIDTRVAHYLELGNQRLAEDRLSKPDNDNAAFYFSQILGWESDNPQAQQGLNKVAERFAELARAATARREYNLASQYVNQGLQVDPRNRALMALQNRPASGSRPSTTSGSRASSPPPSLTDRVKRVWNRLFD